MSNYIVTDTELTSIADTIRTKSGQSGSLSFPTGFISGIESISSGGGGITTLVGYTDKNAYYLYADEELATPWTEVHGGDYEELYDEMVNADKFVVRQPGSSPSQYIPARIEYDPVEPEIRLYIWAGNQMKFISV